MNKPNNVNSRSWLFRMRIKRSRLERNWIRILGRGFISPMGWGRWSRRSGRLRPPWGRWKASIISSLKGLMMTLGTMIRRLKIYKTWLISKRWGINMISWEFNYSTNKKPITNNRKIYISNTISPKLSRQIKITNPINKININKNIKLINITKITKTIH